MVEESSTLEVHFHFSDFFSLSSAVGRRTEIKIHFTELVKGLAPTAGNLELNVSRIWREP